MGFYSIVDESQLDSSDLPWLNEYIDLNPKTTTNGIYLVSHVKSTKKGYILTTEFFNAWVWRSSKPGTALQTGLTDSVQSDSYPHLAVQIKPKVKDKFVLGFLDDCMASYTWNPDDSTFSLSTQKSLPLEVSPNEKK